MKKFDPGTIYAPHGLYYNAVRLEPGAEIVFSSGIIGAEPDGSIPDTDSVQIDRAWANVAAFLEGCGLTPENLVRLKIHLTDRNHLALSKAARIRHLGDHMNCAVTGVIVALFDPSLIIEIDVVAAKPGEG